VSRGSARPVLGRSIGTAGFFALAFGSMIGVGWVTALGSWLSQAGPLGAIAAFLAGGLLMVAIGMCYAELTPMLPLAGGEVAYAYRASGTRKAFVVGWFLAFGYLSVSAFEAVSVGRVLGYLVPGLDRWPLWEIDGHTVYGAHLVLAAAFTGAITWVNYRGARYAARVQTVLTAAFVLVAAVFVVAGFAVGAWRHVGPLVPRDPAAALTGFASVLVTAPFWFVGFDTIPQGAEEANLGLPPRRLGTLILTSIVCAAGFYALLILSVSMTGPWSELVDAELPTAAAFERVFPSGWMVDLVLIAALLGLLTSWNGFFLAGARVIFALGRGRIVPAALGTAHPRFGTPAKAVLFSGAVTFAGALLGRGAMLAFVDVGSLCIAIAFLGVTQATLVLRRTAPDEPRPYRIPGGLWWPRAAFVDSAAILLALLVPGSPVALVWPLEWGVFGGVLALGLVCWVGGARPRSACSERERAELVLGEHAPRS
jgi:amino acid transporter